MKKLARIITILLSLVSIFIMVLMLNAVSEFSHYVTVGAVITAFILETIAVVSGIISMNLVFDIVSTASTLIASIIGFSQYSTYQGWSDLKIFSIFCLIFAVGPILEGLADYLKSKKKTN